jgi:hypothetical protein
MNICRQIIHLINIKNIWDVLIGCVMLENKKQNILIIYKKLK